eukprot:762128-Hanusia_phi.AAC.9
MSHWTLAAPETRTTWRVTSRGATGQVSGSIEKDNSLPARAIQVLEVKLDTSSKTSPVPGLTNRTRRENNTDPSPPIFPVLSSSLIAILTSHVKASGSFSSAQLLKDAGEAYFNICKRA